MTDDYSAALFALAAAAGFGASVHAQRRALDGMDASAGALIGTAVATLIFASAARFVVDPAWIRSEATASPVYAALVTFAVSTLLLAMVNARSLPRILRGGPGLGWFAAAGAIHGFSMLGLNTALQSGVVVVAAPLAATAPLWALVWGALVFRSERSALRHLGIAALAMSGAALIVAQ